MILASLKLYVCVACRRKLAIVAPYARQLKRILKDNFDGIPEDQRPRIPLGLLALVGSLHLEAWNVVAFDGVLRSTTYGEGDNFRVAVPQPAAQGVRWCNGLLRQGWLHDCRGSWGAPNVLPL